MRIVAGQRAYGPQQGTSDDHKMLPGGAGVWAMDCVMARVAGDWRFARTLMSCLCRPMAGGSTPSALGRRYAGEIGRASCRERVCVWGGAVSREVQREGGGR